MKIMIAVLVTLAILILFQVLYFTYCNLTYKGDEDGIKVSYLENHKFVNKFARELSELDIAIINSIFSDAGISQDYMTTLQLCINLPIILSVSSERTGSSCSASCASCFCTSETATIACCTEGAVAT